MAGRIWESASQQIPGPKSYRRRARDKAKRSSEEHSNKCDIQKFTPDTIFESLPQKMEEKIQALRRRSEPVNILVVGPTGVGKSTLVNALLGDIVAKAHYGAESVTAVMNVREGTFMGVKVRVYDAVGFGDTKGRSNLSTIDEMAKTNRFDLILICVRMDIRANEGVKMFTTLSAMMHPEAWKRSVVVLTFVNFFLQQGPPSTPNEEKEKEVTEEIETFRNQISKAVNKKVFSDVPFCIAGKIEERELPTTNDWLFDLWAICLQQCSDKARPLFQAYSTSVSVATAATTAIVGGAGAIVGGGIGAIAGSIVMPGGGTALGAALGATIGTGAGALGSGIAAAIGKFLTKEKNEKDKKNVADNEVYATKLIKEKSQLQEKVTSLEEHVYCVDNISEKDKVIAKLTSQVEEQSQNEKQIITG